MVHYGIGTEYYTMIILASYKRVKRLRSWQHRYSRAKCQQRKGFEKEIIGRRFSQQICFYFIQKLAVATAKSPGYLGGICCKEASTKNIEAKGLLRDLGRNDMKQQLTMASTAS